ncbi:MAG: metal ABC transporter ATP-binding protein [Solirubrobacteraceae bacterium]
MSAELVPAGAVAARAPVLAVDHVDIELGGRSILGDVSFQLHSGQLTGLIGANGSGKTTLFRVILGLQRPRSGAVRLGAPPRAARRATTIGYVPQKFMLDPEAPLRARDVVALGLDGHKLGVPLPSRRRRTLVEEMLDAVAALPFADVRVGNLSGGEQQRVLIAHALVSQPQLILLDEPLANLDLGSGQEVVELLASIASQRGVAVLVSAHEMNPLLPVMDRIVYLAAGRAASGTTEEVVRADVLSRLYRRHVDVIHVHGRVLVVAGAGEASDLSGHEAGLGVGPADGVGRDPATVHPLAGDRAADDEPAPQHVEPHAQHQGSP